MFHSESMNMRRMIFSLLLIGILSLGVAFPALAYKIPAQTDEFYVNDFAGLLDEETEDYIIEVNKEIYQVTGAQVVVVTVDNLDGASIEEYATALFRQYGIGDAQQNNGVLLLLALEERQFRIEVGYGLEGILNDAKTGRIQDQYIIPYLKEDNWKDGIVNGFNAIIDLIASDSNSQSIKYNAPEEPKEDNTDYVGMGVIGACFAVGLVLGKVCDGHEMVILGSGILVGILFGMIYGVGWGFVIGFAATLSILIGYAITCSNPGGSSGGSSYHSHSSYHSSGSSHSYSSSHSSGGSRGGGGSSGGGGSTRSF